MAAGWTGRHRAQAPSEPVVVEAVTLTAGTQPQPEPAAAMPQPDPVPAPAEADFDPTDFLFGPEPEPDPAAFLLDPAPQPAPKAHAPPQPEFVAYRLESESDDLQFNIVTIDHFAGVSSCAVVIVTDEIDGFHELAVTADKVRSMVRHDRSSLTQAI